MNGAVYLVTLGEETVSVTLRRDGDRLLVRVGDGPEQPASLTRERGTLRTLALGVRRVELLADRTTDGAHVAINGLTYAARVVDEARARLAGMAGAAGNAGVKRALKAPMPGLVVNVLCQPGDLVARGQPLVVLQAMKMENELSVPHEGVVKSVSVQPGETVDQNQVLVTLE